MIDEYTKKWIVKALEDFRVAKHELSQPEGEMATGAACFHCQQMAEKLLKAFLITKEIDFGKTHDLKFLLKLCSDKDPDFKNLEVGNLTAYAVDIRYPDEFHIPSIQEVRTCFRIAQKIKDFVIKKLGIKEQDFQ